MDTTRNLSRKRKHTRNVQLGCWLALLLTGVSGWAFFAPGARAGRATDQQNAAPTKPGQAPPRAKTTAGTPIALMAANTFTNESFESGTFTSAGSFAGGTYSSNAPSSWAYESPGGTGNNLFQWVNNATSSRSGSRFLYVRSSGTTEGSNDACNAQTFSANSLCGSTMYTLCVYAADARNDGVKGGLTLEVQETGGPFHFARYALPNNPAWSDSATSVIPWTQKCYTFVTSAATTSAKIWISASASAADSITTSYIVIDDASLEQVACATPPNTYSVGNRIWRDNGAGSGGVANDGILNGTEAGISGVFVTLYPDADGNGVADTPDYTVSPARTGLITVTTDSAGYYRFDGVAAGKYVVGVNASSFATGQPLAGLTSTATTATSASNSTDSRDNGVDNYNPVANGVFSGTFDLSTKTFPTGETNPGSYGSGSTNGTAAADNRNDLTIDFAFNDTYSVGNRVWRDNGAGGGTANDGILNGTEAGINGVSVSIFADADSNGVPDGAALATVTTATANGNAGYYRFDGLAAGRYVVGVNAASFASGQPLDGLISTATTGTSSSNGTDSRDNGVDNYNPAGNSVYSGTFNLAAKAIPTGETNPASYGAGSTNGTTASADNRHDLTIDFAFNDAYSVGNRVWRDNGAGGGTASNGTLDGSEPGISGVTVGLYADNDSNGVADGAALATVTTDSNGYYRFDGLLPGKFVIGLPAANFGSGQPLNGLESTATSGTSSSNTADSKDNGVNNATPTANGIFSGTFNLATKTIPSGETNPGSYGSGATNGTAVVDNRNDLTIDFGFVPAAPLAARLTGFTAQAADGFSLTRMIAGEPVLTGVTVRWQTGFEAGNLGFNLYRDEGGARVRVNPSLIAGSALLAGAATLLTAGNSYVWHDAQGSYGASYWLEALDLNGASEWHGPVWATGGDAGTLQFQRAPNAPLLAELNATANRAAQTESVSARVSSPTVREGLPTAPQPARDDKPTAAWTLPSQTAAKLLVRQAGWYRVTAAELQAAGFDTKVNPVFLQLWADGAEVPMTVNRQGNRLESLEFYGTGLDTPATNTRVYWLAIGLPNARRLDVARAPLAERANTASFRATVERQDRLIYFSGLLNGDAENWFGPVISANGALQKLTLAELALADSAPATLELVLQGVTEQPHSVSVELNGRQLGVVNFANRDRHTARLDVPAAWLSAGDNEIKLTGSGGSDISLVETVRLTYARTYRASGDTLQFGLEPGETATLTGFSTPELRLLHRRGDRVRELTVAAQPQPDGSYGCTLPGEGGAYLALADTRLASVAGIKLNQPSNWRAAINAADFVIVTPRNFWTAANRLAQARRSQELRVAVVDVEDAYDEFSFGAKSAQAVKDLLSYARANWLVKPRFALFLGDATYDPRNYLGAGDYDFVPTKLGATYYFETALDNWFADANADSVPELALGRLPVRTAAQADALVGKILAFKLPVTPRNSLFVSDRTVEGVDFQAMSTQLAGMLPTAMPKQFVNRNDGPPEQVRAQIIGNINQGTPLIVNWLGHGSTQVWTGDGLLRTQDAAVLTNAATSLFVMTTCLNGFFTDPNLTSLSEAVLLDTPGGAFAVISSSGLNDAAPQNVFNLTLYQNLFGRGLTLGEAMTAARVAAVDVDVRNTYVLFGDPTLRVNVRR